MLCLYLAYWRVLVRAWHSWYRSHASQASEKSSGRLKKALSTNLLSKSYHRITRAALKLGLLKNRARTCKRESARERGREREREKARASAKKERKGVYAHVELKTGFPNTLEEALFSMIGTCQKKTGFLYFILCSFIPCYTTL